MLQKFNLKKFFSPLKGNWSFLIKPFFVSCLWAVFSIVTVEIFKKATVFIQEGNYEGIKFSLIIYIGICLLNLLLSRFLRNEGWIKMHFDGENLIQKAWMPKFFKLNNTEVEKLGTGRMQSIMNRGFFTWNSLYTKLAGNLPVILVTGLYALFQIYLAIGIWYTLLFLVLLILLTLLVKFLNKYAIFRRNKRTEVRTDYNRHFVKMLMSKMEIVQNNKEIYEIDKSDKLLKHGTNLNKKVGIYLYLMGQVSRTFSWLLNIFILVYGLIIVYKGGELSIFVGLIASSTLFSSAMDNFVQFYKEFTNELADVYKLWDTFNIIPNMKNKYSDIPFKFKNGKILVEDLDFSYDEYHKIFDKLSLSINGGEKTAFVGESGSGKSTLIKLLAGYLAPDDGKIFVDDQDISEVNIYDYFKYIGYLTQEPSVFDGTIYDNLIYALKEPPTEKKLKNVIKDSKCEFIYDFVDGLQTEIGERGVRLSGGQKQRLAIAKIMLKNPNIILLDEPTSALDSFNEEEITQALNNLFKGKTVVVVAHRLQTVKNADKIFLFEDGKVVEEGTHQSLIKKNGKYKKMLDLQSGF